MTWTLNANREAMIGIIPVASSNGWTQDLQSSAHMNAKDMIK
jgi:hypothetical protein